MADFNLSSFSSAARTLAGTEMGFISASGFLSVSGAAAVTATAGTNWLTVLGAMNAYGGGFAAVDANGAVFEMAVGRDGYVTAEKPTGGVIDVNVSTVFRLFNQGTIYSSSYGAVDVNDTDGGVTVDIANSGEMRANFGDVVSVNAGTGDITFDNSGSIFGDGQAVRLFQDADSLGSLYVTNTGTVTSTSRDAFVIDQGLGTTQFFNAGRILANNSAVEFNDNGNVLLTNSGLIDGQSRSIGLDGSGNDTVINTGTLIGEVDLGAGNDTIDTQDGVVVGQIQGGLGNDSYYVSDETSELVEFFNQGTDTVYASGNFHVIDFDIENLVLQGAGNTRGAGNFTHNQVTGNVGDNALFGFSGSDTILGLGGDDKAFGGANNDTVEGGDGNDWVHGGGGDDSVNGGAGRDTVEGGSGNDLVRTGNSGADEGGIANGGSGNDTLFGNDDDDILNGDSGDDALFGDAGADTHDGGTGTDTLTYIFSPGRVVVNLGANFFSGNDAEGDRASRVENLTGSNLDDILVGSSGANFIRGLLGADELRGADGNDTLQGGLAGDILNGQGGLDTADYSDSPARVLVNLGAGFADQGYATGDTLISIERLVGSNFNDVLVGNAGGNRLFGGPGPDQLRGEGSGDRLYGGLGNDELQGDSGPDQFIFETVFGNDTINDFLDGTDTIEFSGIPGVTQFSDVTVTISGADLVLDVGGADSVRLLGANGSVTLTDVDFVFS